MAKIKYEIDLEEERELVEIFAKALDMSHFIHNLDEKFRQLLKHGQQQFQTPEEVMEYVRDQITEDGVRL